LFRNFEPKAYNYLENNIPNVMAQVSDLMIMCGEVIAYESITCIVLIYDYISDKIKKNARSYTVFVYDALER
jgi:hypothetical protein